MGNIRIKVFKFMLGLLPFNLCQSIEKRYFHNQFKKNKFVSSEIEFFELGRWINKGDCCLDIGANVGRYTLKMAELTGVDGHVFSFEPLPEIHEILTYMIRKSHFKNITAFNCAVGDEVSMVAIEQSGLINKDTVLFDTYTSSSVSNNGVLNTLCLPIDNLDIPMTVALVKVDVEGYELQVLKGMSKLIERDHPMFIVESNSESNREFLFSKGYKSLPLNGADRNEVFVYSEKLSCM
ncbi:FkbM family methyltransferase [Catenovulum sediminis]|uniref:FkbM family methyltransferase n=1 Tax=Catenovulum sediminis TaxID=1740262 RepID=UPI00163DA2A3|nr:FkbM family methyltransferase [Catenovulum sediminis]